MKTYWHYKLNIWGLSKVFTREESYQKIVSLKDAPVEEQVKEIKKIWGKNKSIPKKFEIPFYLTIAKYPELKNTILFVRETNFYGIQHTLRSYPPLLSLWRRADNRVYPITINIGDNVPILFDNLTLEQQIGVMAHEFAHVLDYTKRSTLQILSLSWNFATSKTFLTRLERITDKTVISRGFGHHLLDFRIHVLQNSEINNEQYKKLVYLNPLEITQELKIYPELYNEEGHEHGLKQLLEKIRHTQSTDLTYWKAFIFSVKHTLRTAIIFFPEIFEMMWLVYIRKTHNKRY